jgi:hypothetical protein
VSLEVSEQRSKLGLVEYLNLFPLRFRLGLNIIYWRRCELLCFDSRPEKLRKQAVPYGASGNRIANRHKRGQKPGGSKAEKEIEVEGCST